MLNPIEVSICVITYNQEKTIRETLESILNQLVTFNIEIIIGNDCSTDNTELICLEYLNMYPHQIKLYSHSSNMGLMKNYEFVTSHVQGKYFGVCAGDDYWHNNNKLQKQYDYMESHPECGFVHSGCTVWDINANSRKDIINDASQTYTFYDNIKGNEVFAVTAFYRVEIFKKNVSIKKYIDLGFLMEDYPTLLDLSLVCEIGYIQESLATYRLEQNTISHPKDAIKHIHHTNNIFEIKKYFLNKAKASRHIINSILFEKDIIYLHYFFSKRTFYDRITFIKEVNWINVFKYYLLKH